MSGNFQVGDIVVCVDNSPGSDSSHAGELKLRTLYRVGAVGICKGAPCVAFAAHPGDIPNHGWAFHSRRFRYVPKADDTFTAQMRAMRPRKAGAPA